MLVGLVWACRRNQPGLWLLGGVLIGLAAMVKPIAQGFLPLAVVAAYLVGASWRTLVGQARWPAPTRAAIFGGRDGRGRLRARHRALVDPESACAQPGLAEHVRPDADRADGLVRSRLRLRRSEPPGV